MIEAVRGATREIRMLEFAVVNVDTIQILLDLLDDEDRTAYVYETKERK